MCVISNVALVAFAIAQDWHPAFLAWPFLCQSMVFCFGTAARIRRCRDSDDVSGPPGELLWLVFLSSLLLLHVLEKRITAGALYASLFAGCWQAIESWRRVRQDAALPPRAKDLTALFDSRVLIVSTMIPLGFALAAQLVERWWPALAESPVITLIVFGMVKLVADAWTLRREQRILSASAAAAARADDAPAAPPLARQRTDAVPWDFTIPAEDPRPRDDDPGR